MSIFEIISLILTFLGIVVTIVIEILRNTKK